MTADFFNYVYTKRKDLDDGLPELEVVALRGSNPDYPFYAPSWENSFNLGLTSGNIFLSLELYRKLLRNAPNLKVVLFFVNIIAPGYNLGMTSERARLVSYKHFFGVDYNRLNRIEPKTEKRILKKISKSKFLRKKSIRGFVFDKPHFPNIDIKKRVAGHLRENRREPDQMEHFYELQRLIEADGRRLYLVIPPFRSDFRAELESQAGIVGKGDLFKKFESVMSKEQVLDFYNCDEISDDDFGDCDHLSEAGAQKLTAMIRCRIAV